MYPRVALRTRITVGYYADIDDFSNLELRDFNKFALILIIFLDLMPKNRCLGSLVTV